ncbi:MAG: hypothetical protein QME76_02940 [Bacillota bacterium]|nr:hypothetical protein [Bacillota bacterium]
MDTREVKALERHSNFPVDGQDYCLGQGDDGRWFFAWGYRWPRNGKVPAEDLEDGNNGIHWHDAPDDARRDMREAMDLFDADDGGYNPIAQYDVLWPY